MNFFRWLDNLDITLVMRRHVSGKWHVQLDKGLNRDPECLLSNTHPIACSEVGRHGKDPAESIMNLIKALTTYDSIRIHNGFENKFDIHAIPKDLEF